MKAIDTMKIKGCFLGIILSMGYVLAQTTTPATQSSTATPHNVGVNSTHVYDVAYTVRGATPNLYSWTIYTADASYAKGAAAVSGTDYTMTAGANAAIQSIIWLKAGYYVIELQESNPAANGSCPGTLQSLNVHVGPTGTVEFTSATGTNQCPATGGYSPSLSYTGSISYPIKVYVQYTINTTTTSDSITVANATAALSIPAGIAFLANATDTDDTNRRVTITGAKDSFGGNLSVGTTAAHTLTIWSIPATTPIHHD